MKFLQTASVVLAGGLLLAGSAMAQTTPKDTQPTPRTAQKQHTQEGPSDGMFDKGGTPSQAYKQHTAEGPSDGAFSTGPASAARPK